MKKVHLILALLFLIESKFCWVSSLSIGCPRCLGCPRCPGFPCNCPSLPQPWCHGAPSMYVGTLEVTKKWKFSMSFFVSFVNFTCFVFQLDDRKLSLLPGIHQHSLFILPIEMFCESSLLQFVSFPCIILQVSKNIPVLYGL